MTVGNIQYKKTKIGQIPEDWDVVKIGNVVQKASQRDPRKKPLSQFKYVDISSISNDLYKITDFQILSGKNAPSRAKKVIKLNDIIYATVRPYLKRIAIVPQELDNEICSTGFCVIRCDSKSADYRYVFYILLSEWLTQRLTDLQKGSSYPAITDKDIYSQFVPLPHISEQRKSAEILSTVDADIEKTDAIIKETQQLKKELMEKLFTEGIGHKRFKKTKIGRIPEEWLVEKFTKLIQLKHGHQFRDYDFVETGIPVIKIANLKDGSGLNMGDLSFISHHRDREFEDKKIFKDDILMALTGATLGKVCRVDDDFGIILQNYRVGKFLPTTDAIFHDFIYYLLQSKKFQNKMFSFINEGAQPNVGKADFDKIYIQLPSKKEQIKILEILKEIDSKIEIERTIKSELEQLKKGLLQVLLTGKVRVKI